MKKLLFTFITMYIVFAQSHAQTPSSTFSYIIYGDTCASARPGKDSTDVRFTIDTISKGVSYAWNFDTSGIAPVIGSSVLVYFKKCGIYTIICTATDSTSLLKSVYTHLIYIKCKPELYIIGGGRTGCTSVTNTYIASPYAYPKNGTNNLTWDINGLKIPGDSITHIFQVINGIISHYSVMLIDTFSNGCVTSYTLNNAVTVYPSPVVTVSITPDTIFTGGLATLTITSDSMQPLSGTFASSPTLNIAYTYGSFQVPDSFRIGNYAITYTPIYSNGCIPSSSSRLSGKFTIVSSCNAHFAYYGNDTVVSFQNTSAIVDSTITFLWQFGDGDTSTLRNQTHTYTSYGTKYVCLTVVDTARKCNATYCDSIRLYPVCNALFTIDSMHAMHNTAYFTNHSANTTSQIWDFGDSTSSTSFNPVTHVYTYPGVYTVCLTVFDSTYCQKKTCRTLHLDSAQCHAMFTVDSTDTVTHIVYVTNHSIGTASLEWTFGDGDSSNISALTHNYTIGGTYQLCLRTVCTNGDTSSYCAYINGDSSRVRSSHSFKVIISNYTTGTNTIADASIFKLYPNPAYETVTINTPQAAHMSIVNLLGEVVYAENIHAGNNSINIANLPASMYTVVLKTNDGIISNKKLCVTR